MNMYSQAKLVEKILALVPLEAFEAEELFKLLVNEETPQALSGAILGLLSCKAIHKNELIGFSQEILKHSTSFKFKADSPLLDIVGSGGDNYSTFNVSTASAFVLSSAGYKVAKHGNRAITSNCGSADVIEALGIKLDLEVEELETGLLETNFCFLFAPKFHPLLKQLSFVRKALPFRTIFNFLGPLINPAKPTHMLIGVSDKDIIVDYAKAVAQLEFKEALVVHSQDGLDEITNTASSIVYKVEGKKLTKFVFNPQEYGFKLRSISEIKGGTAVCNAKLFEELFTSKANSALEDIVVLNVGWMIYLLEKIELKLAFKKARSIITSGQAYSKLQAVRKFYR